MSDTSQGEPGSAQHILHLVSSGAATSRADLVRELGLAPSTVSLRVQELVAAGVLTESGEGASRGGRRPRLLRVRAQGGVALAADLGSHHARLGVVGLDGTVLDAVDLPHDITVGPESAVDWLCGQVTELAARQREAGRTVRALGVGFPARSSPARAAS
ncbi:winged helix-turn-helix domain-containing protein [Streptomyces sp. NBC_01378]|uniref:winged helix-turn-helix transcriptional regulator n=1 Tax=Streptomyces sp. NBC_01378 TaxID=2903844 RepID=UPI0032459116